MAEHWPQIALVDLGCKVVVSLGLFIPIYGVLLNYLTNKITHIDCMTSHARLEMVKLGLGNKLIK